MGPEKPLQDLSKNFHEEEKLLLAHGISTWFSLKSLTDRQISALVKNGRGTSRNFKRLRGIATLVCDLNLSQANAALLMHAGIASITALASLTPQELIQKTGRLERQLRTGREPVLDLTKAHSWIQKAKNRQIQN